MTSGTSSEASRLAADPERAAADRAGAQAERAWPIDLAPRIARDRSALGGALFVLLLVVLAVVAPLVSPYDPYEVSFADRNKGPSAAHLFGTDEFGRDLLTRIADGGRISLVVGLVAAIIGAPSAPATPASSGTSSPTSSR